MNRAVSIYRVQTWAIRRFDTLHSQAYPLRPSLTPNEERILSLVAIESANTWAALMRSYWLAASIHRWRRDGTQVKISASIRSFEDAITFAVHTTKPRLRVSTGPWKKRDEPDWLDPATVSTLLRAAGADIEGGFHAAISLGSTARQDLSTYRNFVAHRNRDTALKVRNLCPDPSLKRSTSPLEIALLRGPGRPQPLVLDWIDDLRTMCSLLPS